MKHLLIGLSRREESRESLRRSRHKDAIARRPGTRLVSEEETVKRGSRAPHKAVSAEKPDDEEGKWH